jgi:hypothetical protein
MALLSEFSLSFGGLRPSYLIFLVTSPICSCIGWEGGGLSESKID